MAGWVDLYKSVSMDLRTLNIPTLSRREGLLLVLNKTRAVTALLAKGSACWQIGENAFEMQTLFDVGTFQRNVLEVAAFLRPHIRIGNTPTIIDVGANAGQFAAGALLCWPHASLVCFEPDPLTFAQLEKNLGGRPNVELRCAAAGPEPGTLTFYRHELSVRSSLRADVVPEEERIGEIQVETVRLDDDCRNLKAIDLLKIDVEGFELEALRGAVSLLDRTRYLYVEISVGERDLGQTLQVFELVHDVVRNARLKAVGHKYTVMTPNGPEVICQDVLLELVG